MQLYSNGDYQIAPKAMFSFVPLFKLKAKHFFLCFLIVTTLIDLIDRPIRTVTVILCYLVQDILY